MKGPNLLLLYLAVTLRVTQKPLLLTSIASSTLGLVRDPSYTSHSLYVHEQCVVLPRWWLIGVPPTFVRLGVSGAESEMNLSFLLWIKDPLAW